MATLAEVERELGRVVDRLGSMPLDRAAASAPACRAAAQVLIDQARALGGRIPADARVPDLGPQGLGSMIAVLGDDLLAAARAATAPDLDPVLDALVGLRRALP